MMTRLELSDLFGGREENVHYFIQLTHCLTQLRNQGGQTPCFDPRDAAMKARIETLKWAPTVRLRLPDEFDHLDGRMQGHRDKQTALDDGTEEEEEGRDEEAVTEGGKTCGGGGGGRRMCVKGNMEEGDFPCGVYGCSQKFTSLASFESHYHMCHNYECASCKRSFVSNFLLDLHLQENHDSYFQILSSRIDMYQCLVESCDFKFRTPDLRKDHLVVHHKYPANFSFHQPLKPRIKGTKGHAKSNKEKPKDANLATTTMDTEAQSNDGSVAACQSFTTSQNSPSPKSMDDSMDFDVDGTESSKPTAKQSSKRGGKRGAAAGNRVPGTICFGRGSQRAFRARGRGGRGRHWHQGKGEQDTTVDIEQMDFKDMSQALEA